MTTTLGFVIGHPFQWLMTNPMIPDTADAIVMPNHNPPLLLLASSNSWSSWRSILSTFLSMSCTFCHSTPYFTGSKSASSKATYFPLVIEFLTSYCGINMFTVAAVPPVIAGRVYGPRSDGSLRILRTAILSAAGNDSNSFAAF